MKNQRQKAAYLAESLGKQHNDLHVKNFLFFLDLADVVNWYMETEMRRVGLTRTQAKILHFLITQPRSMTPTELCNYTRRTKDTTTKAVNALERMNLVSSIRSKSDRRLRRVRLTNKGLNLMEELLPLRYQVFKNAMHCFTQEDSEKFNMLLKQFGNHMSNLTADRESNNRENVEYKPAMLHLLAGVEPPHGR